MKRKSIYWISIVAISILGVFIWNYLYQDHRNIANETARYELTGVQLGNDFIANYESSSEKYLNEVVLVSGTVTEVSDDGVVLDEHIFLQLSENQNTKVSLQNKFKFKGRCIGFDDLLELVKIDQCTIQIY